MRQMNFEDRLGYILDMVSIMVGLENLQENRDQTKANDVNQANDKQYQALVEALRKENSEQASYILRALIDRLDRIEKKVDALLSRPIFSETFSKSNPDESGGTKTMLTWGYQHDHLKDVFGCESPGKLIFGFDTERR